MSIDALQAKIRKLKNPSMIGLDPTVELLPPHLLEEAYRTHGQSLEALAAAYETFCGEILQALQGLVPAVMVQSYCFDALGSCGIAAMQRLLREGKTDFRYFPEYKPDEAEAEAVSRCIRIARETGCKLLIRHISSMEAAEAIAEAQAQVSEL